MWSGTGTPGSLGGAPSSKEEAAVTQLLPAAVEIVSSGSAARPQQAPPWGLDRESAFVSSGLESDFSVPPLA